MNISYHKFHYGNNFIDYSVIRSKRLKTSEVIVDEKNVILRVPANKPDSEIHNILQRKGQWIIEKKKQYSESKKQIRESTFEIDSTLPYLGKNYLMARDSYNDNQCLELRRGQFLVRTNNLSRSNVLNMYKKWLMQKSEVIFHTRVREYSKKLKLRPPKITIKNLRNRWGSVTKGGVMNLNVNLVKAPSEVVDHIIVHELYHFKIKKHSHHFWELLSKTLPNYKDSIIWLENNASLLLNND